MDWTGVREIHARRDAAIAKTRTEYQKLYMREWRAKRKAEKGPSPLEVAQARVAELEAKCAAFEGWTIDFQGEIEALHETLNDRVEWAGKLQDGLTMIVTRLAGNDKPLAVELRKIAEGALNG